MRSLLLAVVAVGAGLRIWQYAAGTSLYIDEVPLSRDIIDLDLFRLLTEPLSANQVAPKGFLLVEKLMVTVLGPSDYVLRLFPLVCSVIALVAFWRLSLRMLQGVGPVVAISLFATAAPLVAYGSFVKQYSTDVCVAVLMWWLAHELTSRPVTARGAGVAALIGAGLVWFSQSAVLMAAALSIPLALWLKPEPAQASRWSRLALILVCWGASALAVTVVSVSGMTPDTVEYMRRFWAGGFAPDSWSQELRTQWPGGNLRRLFGPGTPASLSYSLWPLYLLLTAIGYAVLWLQHRRTAVILAIPVAVTLGAAVAHQYPFRDRLILFLVPGFFLAIGAVIESAHRAVGLYSKPLGRSLAAGLVLPALSTVAFAPPPYWSEHMKPVLSDVRARWRPDDIAYVFYRAAPVVMFYATQYGFGRADYAVGGCHLGDTRGYLDELDTFRGRPRVWVLLTHTRSRYREREDLLAYLDTIGTRTESLVVESYAPGVPAPPAEAYLYDLSSSTKLASSTADSFPLMGPQAADPRLRRQRLEVDGASGCGTGPYLTLRSDFPCPRCS